MLQRTVGANILRWGNVRVPRVGRQRRREATQPVTLRGRGGCASICGRPLSRAPYCNSRTLLRPDRTSVIYASAVSSTARQAPPPAQREVFVTADKVAKSHDGTRNLFADLSFTVGRGDRLAVVGPNGCGKSTLLRVLAGKDDATSGAITRRRGVTVAMLEQDPTLPEGCGALEAVLSMDTPQSRAAAAYEAALEAVEGGAPGAQAELSRCTTEMDAAGAWEFSNAAKEILLTLGIKDMSLRVDDMSGGQRRRVALAAAMLSKPDLLLLDEPTNHMYVGVIQWMEEWLKGSSSMAVVFITHDRAFMEVVGSQVLELDIDGGGYLHRFGGAGSYEQFQQARAERRAAQAAAAAKAKTLLRTETEWMRRQPKARSTKAKARIDAFYELTSAARSGPKADLSVSFDQGRGMSRQGKRVMELKEAGYAWGDAFPVFEGLSYNFEPGERIGIVGPNGCGKSTLLDALVGRVALTAGTLEVGETTCIGYFEQHPPAVRGGMRVADYMSEIADTANNRQGGGKSSWGDDAGMTPTNALDQVGFPRERQYQMVELLSGGERRRLHLAATLLSSPNMLLLDEPTNDLDLQTIEMLEAMLERYQGVLLVVSHDFQFMDNNVDRLIVFKGDGKVALFDGTYSDYIAITREEAARQGNNGKEKSSGGRQGAAVQEEEEEATPAVAAAPSKESDAPKKLLKLGYREKQEFKGLDGEIEELQAETDKLQAELDGCSASGDYMRVEALAGDLAKVEASLEMKETRWLELAERADIG